MTALHRETVEKHYKKVWGQVRRIAETVIAEGNILKFGSAEHLVVANTLNGIPVGLALNSVTALEIAAYAADSSLIAPVEVDVQVAGFGVLLAGDAVTVGNFVKSDANARGIPITGDATDWVLGKAYKSAAANGDEFHVLINLIPATSR